MIWVANLFKHIFNFFVNKVSGNQELLKVFIVVTLYAQFCFSAVSVTHG